MRWSGDHEGRHLNYARENTPQDLGLNYRAVRRKGLEGIEIVGRILAQVVEALTCPQAKSSV